MKQRSWLALASLICICGCNEDPGNGVTPEVNYCFPGCDLLSEKCVDGTCVSLCAEPCGEGMRCELGECIPAVCEPACGEGTTCVNGECVPLEDDPNTCKGLICKDGTTRCNPERGEWEACPLGTGCHLGYCLEGFGPECEEGTCSEDGRKVCLAGKWSSCGSKEACIEGKCELVDGDCAPGSCSEDGVYVCNEEGVFEACGIGMSCKEGRCDIDYNEEAAMLWKICERNSDCPSGMCLFELTPSREFSSVENSLVKATKLPVSIIDPRIPEGAGICSADCTKDASICDSLNTNVYQYSCQVVLQGDSPYPVIGENGVTLPFHKSESFNESDMAIAPYASICRPNDAYGLMYSKSFCASCSNSADCSSDEVCAGGFCTSKCGSNFMCPLGFSCVSLSGDVDANDRVCMPNSGTCDSCIDLDNDGQGFGDCPVPGYDCDPVNPDIYYTTALPKVCTHDVTDTNCNGKIDTFELLNRSEHCRFCGDICQGTAENKMSRACEFRAGKTLDDYEFSSFNPSDETTYLTQCRDTCLDGWGDCNRDHRDGCEVNLIESGVKYSWDDDKDGFGTEKDAEQSSVYCCSYDKTNCYAYQGTRYGKFHGAPQEVSWDRAAGDAWDNVQNGVEYVSDDISDCADDSYETRPGTAELCDGVLNSCSLDKEKDGENKDGENDVFIDIKGNKSYLGEACSVYPANGGTTACAQGTVECQVGSDGKFAMRCVSQHAATEKGDQQCDGLDNNCDGLIDESYAPIFKNAAAELNPDGSINICKFRMTNCANGEKYEADGGYQMFNARDYDFYGDGVDSNCDGYDYDMNKAIFVAKNGIGRMDGSDAHQGKYDSPVETLTKAISLACKDAASIYYCQDIIVAKDVDNNWAKNGSITVPTFSATQNIYSGFSRLSSIDELSKSVCSSDGCMSDRKKLLPTETVPPEAVRIYGGFKTTISGNTRSWEKPVDKGATSRYSFEYDPNGKSDRLFALVRGNGNAPLSVKFDRVPIELKSKDIRGTEPAETEGDVKLVNEKLQNGLMLVGLTCGTVGCRHLTLNASPITVTGGKGRDNSGKKHSSIVWDSVYMTGFDGKHFYEDWTDWNGNKKNFETNRSHNAMFSNHYSHLDVWSEVPKSIYDNLKCPDGSSPRGGGPGSYCCKNNCSDINYKSSRAGNSGTGEGTGGSSVRLGVSTGDSCGNSDDYYGKGTPYSNYARHQNGDGTYVMGGNGGHGKGGAGGKNSAVSCEKVYQKDAAGGFYVNCNTAAANGKPGESGGGGGGGTAYQCYARDGKTNAWVHGGSGGAGGCGGSGGQAGGMGVSAIGLVLNPPNSNNDKFSYQVTGSTITAKAGMGGLAQNGQDGVAGGWRGDGFGYGKKKGAIPYHCHRATAGGVGGTGGGGGAGANGKSGEAFGITFIDKQAIDVNTSQSTLESYGYVYTDSLQALFQSPASYVSVSTQKDGASGGNGLKTAEGSQTKDNAGKTDNKATGGKIDQTANGDSMGHSMVLQFLKNSAF